MNLCVNCKFYDPPAHGFRADCTRHRRIVQVADPVEGGTRPVNVGGYGVSPSEERASVLPWKCGSKARHFQPRVTVPR